MQKQSNMNIIFLYMLKVTVLGPHSSGKSYFMYSIRNKSKKELSTSMGVEFFKHVVNLKSQQIELQYWDICGENSYQPLVNTFTKSSQLVLIFFNPINNTIKDFNSWASSFHYQNKKVYVVVNKPNDVAVPKEIYKYERKYGWKVREIDAEHPIQCKNLEKSLIEQNAVLPPHVDSFWSPLSVAGICIGVASLFAVSFKVRPYAL